MSDDNIRREISRLAPSLKPDVLTKAAAGLAKQNIDISNLVRLAEYLDDEKVVKMLEQTDYEKLDGNVLEMFVPFLSPESIYEIFGKILEGELDYHFLSVILPYTDYLIEQIECAVVYGVLDPDALRIVREYTENKENNEKAAEN